MYLFSSINSLIFSNVNKLFSSFLMYSSNKIKIAVPDKSEDLYLYPKENFFEFDVLYFFRKL